MHKYIYVYMCIHLRVSLSCWRLFLAAQWSKAAAVMGRLFVCGGRQSGLTCLNSAEQFLPEEQNQWAINIIDMDDTNRVS